VSGPSNALILRSTEHVVAAGVGLQVAMAAYFSSFCFVALTAACFCHCNCCVHYLGGTWTPMDDLLLLIHLPYCACCCCDESAFIVVVVISCSEYIHCN